MVSAFLALAVAMTVVTACGAMLESGIRFHGHVSRYAAAPVLVATTDIAITEGSGEDADVEHHPLTARAALPAGLADAIARRPGVRAAIGDTAVTGSVVEPAGAVAVQLHPWSAARLAPYRLRAGHAPTRAGELVLAGPSATPARLGTHVSVLLPGGRRTFAVVGVAGGPPAPAGEPETLFLSDAEAAALAHGVVQVIGVLPSAGVSVDRVAAEARTAVRAAVRAAGGPAGNGARPQVRTGADRGLAESLAAGEAREFVIAVSATFGGCALLIAVLVIAGAVGLSVQQRHRDFALLRAIAATPRQVRRLVVRETLTVGLAAAAVGLAPGLAGARWLRHEFVARGLAPASFVTRMSWLPPTVAAAAVLLIAGVAAWIAGLRASRIPPSQALAETAVERRALGPVRAALGVLALAGGITLTVVSTEVGGDAGAGVAVGTVFTLVVAVALLGPLLIRGATALLTPVLRVGGATGRLAAATTAASAGRLATVLSSLVLAVGLGGSLWFVETSQLHVAQRQTAAGLLADAVVTTPGAGLAPELAGELRANGDVVAATGVARGSWVSSRSGGEDFDVQGVDLTGLDRTVDLDVVSGRLADLHGATVAVDTLTADALGLHVGGHLRGWYGDGTPGALRVVAVYRRGLGFAPLTMPRGLVARHNGSGLDDAVLLRLRSAGPAALARVRRAVGVDAPGAVVLDKDAYRVGLDRHLVENAWSQRAVTAVLLVYVVIAAANTLVTYALGRRREFAVLRLAGTTRRQVRRMVALEQALLLGVALAVGLAVAAATLLPMVDGTTGSPRPYIPPAGWAAVLGGLVLLGVAATAAPTRRALAARPVDGIGLRE
jgi:putative ABC transport system permease protein